MTLARRIYLDHNASAVLRPAARAAVLVALDQAGNPSSQHNEGRRTRAMIEEARAKVAALTGGEARQVIFTSGATEALGLALRPGWRTTPDQPACGILLVSATEHAAVHEGNDFAGSVECLPVDNRGVLDLKALENALARARQAGLRPLVALQAANNETGVLQPVSAAAKLVHDAGGLLVCDGVQAAGRIALTFAETNADMIILASHKLGGPKGAGALVLRSEHLRLDHAMIRGGGQEKGFRAGTENGPAIAGFGAAVAEVLAGGETEAEMTRACRDRLEQRLRECSGAITIFGSDGPRLPNTTAFAVPGISAQTLMMALDLAGFAISSGSACSSGKVKRSHVLEAMGQSPELAQGALRVSFGWDSTLADADYFCTAFEQALSRIRQRQ